MLRIEHLSKAFDSTKAVDDITLEVQKGEIFGLLGPNGAGKTTAISMIAGLLKPDSGKIVVESEKCIVVVETHFGLVLHDEWNKKCLMTLHA